jgi:hypothetical protein
VRIIDAPVGTLHRRRTQKRTALPVKDGPYFGDGAWVLETELAVGWLAAALAAVALFVFQHEIDGRR